MTSLIHDLHWLKIPERIQFRLCVWYTAVFMAVHSVTRSRHSSEIQRRTFPSPAICADVESDYFVDKSQQPGGQDIPGCHSEGMPSVRAVDCLTFRRHLKKKFSLCPTRVNDFCIKMLVLQVATIYCDSVTLITGGR